MRTTLTIDDDILATARAYATQRGVSVGEVVSELARLGLAPRAEVGRRNGITLFPVREDGGVVTPEIISELLHAG